MRSSAVPAAERVTSLDVVRGVALYGVMAMNLVVDGFRVSFFERFLPETTPKPWLDRVVENFLLACVRSQSLRAFLVLVRNRIGDPVRSAPARSAHSAPRTAARRTAYHRHHSFGLHLERRHPDGIRGGGICCLTFPFWASFAPGYGQYLPSCLLRGISGNHADSRRHVVS